MKLPIAVALCLAAAPSLARADDDPGMQLMTVMMRCPAMSADGKHVALYANDPGAEKDAKTSLGVFAAAGTVEQRISVVPPMTDVARAKAAAAKIGKLLDDGGYKRMGRVARTSEKAEKLAYATELKSGDAVIAVHLEKRKLAITGTRDGKAFTAVARALPAKDGPCKAVDSYSLANTMAGYDAKSGVLAFSISATQGDTVCFSHDFVVTLK